MEQPMYLGKYAPWEHYPKTLRHAEVQDPLSVLKEFFNTGRVSEHRKELQEWRDCVVSDKVYNEPKHGPGNLLFTHEQNLRVLEASFLLLLTYRENRWRRSEVDENQLAEEESTWSYFLSIFSLEEYFDPYLVVEAVFAEISPQQYRDYLQDWLHSALYTCPIDETVTAGEVIAVYENLSRLYAAAWIIHQRSTEHPDLRREEPDTDDEEINEIQVSDNTASTIRTGLTPLEILGFKEIVNLVFQLEPSIKLIIHLGTSDVNSTHYLYILLDQKRYRPDYELNWQIEEGCKPKADLFVIIDKIDMEADAIFVGKALFDYAENNGTVIHQSNDINLIDLQQRKTTEDIAKSQTWDQWQGQGQAFLKAAGHSIKRMENGFSLYLLYSAIAAFLLGILETATGYKTAMPDLARLVQMSLLLTEEIYQLFMNDPDKALLELLLSFYPVEKRITIEVTEAELEAIMTKALKLSEITAGIATRYMV